VFLYSKKEFCLTVCSSFTNAWILEPFFLRYSYCTVDLCLRNFSLPSFDAAGERVLSVVLNDEKKEWWLTMLKGTRLKISRPYLAAIKRFEIVFRESIVLMLCNIVVYLTISGLCRFYEMKLELLCLMGFFSQRQLCNMKDKSRGL